MKKKIYFKWRKSSVTPNNSIDQSHISDINGQDSRDSNNKVTDVQKKKPKRHGKQK